MELWASRAGRLYLLHVPRRGGDGRRLRDQAGRTDFPFLLSQPAELQLQVIRRQADEGHLRFRPLAQRLFPDTLRAADALARLRRYMEGED